MDTKAKRGRPKKETVNSPAVSKESKENEVAVVSLFDKFHKALEMDAAGTPRNVIINKLGVSSATFYKWINNPTYWADKYEAAPEKVMRTTMEIVRSIREKETSLKTVRSVLSDLELSEYELEFIYNYIHRRNATEAILSVLPPHKQVSRQTAKLKGLKMMQRPQVRKAMDVVLNWELEGIHLTLNNDLIGSLYRMAFYDPAMFIDGQGKSRFKSIDEIPEEYRCCVSGIKPVFHPKDSSRTYYEIQLVNRMEAMKHLKEYSDLFQENNKGLISIGEGISKLADILANNPHKDTVDAKFSVPMGDDVQDVDPQNWIEHKPEDAPNDEAS